MANALSDHSSNNPFCDRRFNNQNDSSHIFGCWCCDTWFDTVCVDILYRFIYIRILRMRKADLKAIAINYCTDVAAADAAPVLLDKAFIQPALLSWYRQNRRKMPWRGDQTSISPSAYGTWISEVMLQQTRVETVIEYWNRWMAVFPDVKTLASASPDEVNKMWAGLGYYRRAQMLLKGANKVVEDFNGVLPDSTQELLTIPGIGPYTAGAIASIAYDKAEPLVDGNVMRVFSRLLALKLEVGGGAMEKQCWKIATDLVPTESPGDFNQALMELGATVCKPTSPDCANCPLNTVCHAKLLVDEARSHNAANKTTAPQDTPAAGMLKLFAKKRKLTEKEDSLPDTLPDTIPDIEEMAGPARNESLEERGYDVSLLPRDVTEFPRKVAKKKAKELTYSVCVLRTLSLSVGDVPHSHEAVFRYLFVRRPATGLLANQWEFPSIHVPTKGEELVAEDDEKEALDLVDPLPSADELWGPFPAYFAERLSMQWTASSNEQSVKKDEKKDNKQFQEECSSPSLHTVLVETAVHEAFEPIVHIFSHQRHTMHVSLRDVQVVQRTESKDTDDITPSGVISKWMTAEEIVEAGITTGCKKVLTQVVKGKTSAAPAKQKQATIGSAKATAKKPSVTKTKVKSEANKPEKTQDATDGNDDSVGEVIDIVDTDDEDVHTSVKQTPKNAFELMKRASGVKSSTASTGTKKAKR